MNTKKKLLRTWSDFGDLRRVPSEYEVVTHNLHYSTRPNRPAALEEGPASPMNLWIKRNRDESLLRADDWNGFRDPDQLTYRKYVTMQDEAETAVAAVLDEYSEIGHDAKLDAAWVDVLARAFTPLRYPLHGFQMCASYVGNMAPTSYVTNAAAFEAADQLRAVSLVAYRTRELQTAHPTHGFATGERLIWEEDERWQPLRRAVERALTTYDWAESFVAVNLVLRPAFDALMYRHFPDAARAHGDDLTWFLLTSLGTDSERCLRWSVALARYALAARESNARVLEEWLAMWADAADEAVSGLARVLSGDSSGFADATAVAASASDARKRVAESIFA